MSISNLPAGRIEYRLIPTIGKIHRVFMDVKDQKSVTCGPYSIMKIARSLGIRPDEELTEDLLAQMCGTIISPEEYELSRRMHDSSESSLDEEIRQRFYPLELEVSESDSLQGTSALGVIDAARSVFGDGYAVYPIPARNTQKIQFTESEFRLIGDAIWNHIGGKELNVIFNVQVDLFCSNGSLKSPVDLFRFLSSERCEELDDWSVGHFIVLAGMVKKVTPDGYTYYYILQDSYKKRGMSGYLIQPEENLRNAMVRNDGSQGGAILLLPKEHGESLLGKLPATLISSGWDNGTPYHRNNELSKT